MTDVLKNVHTKRIPWNKGKSSAQSLRFAPSTSGLSGPNFRSKAAFETSRSSTLLPTASSVVAIS